MNQRDADRRPDAGLGDAHPIVGGLRAAVADDQRLAEPQAALDRPRRRRRSSARRVSGGRLQSVQLATKREAILRQKPVEAGAVGAEVLGDLLGREPHDALGIRERALPGRERDDEVALGLGLAQLRLARLARGLGADLRADLGIDTEPADDRARGVSKGGRTRQEGAVDAVGALAAETPSRTACRWRSSVARPRAPAAARPGREPPSSPSPCIDSSVVPQYSCQARLYQAR